MLEGALLGSWNLGWIRKTDLPTGSAAKEDFAVDEGDHALYCPYPSIIAKINVPWPKYEAFDGIDVHPAFRIHWLMMSDPEGAKHMDVTEFLPVLQGGNDNG